MHMGGFVIVWETTRLADVLNAIGVGTVQHGGDAGDSTYWICYASGGTRPQRIWLISDGEMGGFEHAISQVIAEEQSDGATSQDCPQIPRAFLPVKLSNGLWLGAHEQTVVQATAVDSHSISPFHSIEYQTKVPGNCEGGFDRIDWLDYKIDRGRIAVIWVGQATSC